MRNKYLERIKPSVQKEQDLKKKNVRIKEIKKQAQQQQKKLKQNNKWLQEKGTFDYSGKSLDQNTYDRYWYGVLWISAKRYTQIKQEIQNSQEFALLEQKSFYALKSKFYIKQKMRQTVEDLRKTVQQFGDQDLIQVDINNLPYDFPVSYVLELFEYSGTSIQQIFSIQLIDQQSCVAIVTKKAALTLLSLQGYSHFEKSYIWLQFSKSKGKKSDSKMFKVGTDSNYKLHVRQLNDTLTLEYGRQELVKVFTQEEEKDNRGFRFIVNINCLRRVLMFRGSSIDVNKIQLFQKQ